MENDKMKKKKRNKIETKKKRYVQSTISSLFALVYSNCHVSCDWLFDLNFLEWHH